MISNMGASGGSLPLIANQWVEIRVEIDLDSDKQDFFYNNQLLYSGSWTNEVSGAGAPEIAAVSLFANNATAVYYDNFQLWPSDATSLYLPIVARITNP